MRKRVTRSKMGCLGGGFLVMLAVFILFCSGMNFPVMGKQASFAGTMREDFGLALPASLKVVHAARKAYRDLSYFYECDIASKDLLPFKNAIEAAAKARGDEMGEDQVPSIRMMGGAPPDWFAAESLPDALKLGIRVRAVGRTEEGTGYWFYFSRSRSKVYVYWYSS